MNFIRLILPFVFFSNLAYGQWQWARDAKGDTSHTLAPDIQTYASHTDALGNTYLTGYNNEYALTFGGVQLQGPGYFLVKYDASGSVQWALNGGKDMDGSDVCADANGNVYVTGGYRGTAIFGSFSLTSAGNTDVFVVKYDMNGTPLWARSAGSTTFDGASRIATGPADEVVITGRYGGFGNVPMVIGSITLPATTAPAGALFIAKYDGNGNEQWAKAAPGISNYGGRSVAINAYGEIYLGGCFQASINFGTCASCTLSAPQFSDPNIFITKLDPSGNAIWARAAVGNAQEILQDIALDATGNIYGAGRFNGTSIAFGGQVISQPGQNSIFLVKYDSSGTALWAKRQTNNAMWGGSADAIVTDPAGDIYLTGYYSDSLVLGVTTLFGNGMEELFIAKYTSAGNPIWATSVGTPLTETPIGVGTDAGGNVYAIGWFGGSSVTIGNATLSGTMFKTNDFIAKYTPSGSNIWATKSNSTYFTRHTAAASEGMATDPFGNVYVVGTFTQKIISFGNYTLVNTDTTGATNDFFLVKYSPSGSVLWAKLIGTNSYNFSSSVATDPQGNVYVAGTFIGDSISVVGVTILNTNPTYLTEGFLIKLDASGNALWGKGFGSAGNDFLNKVCTDNTGNVYVTGSFDHTMILGGITLISVNHEDNMFVVKCDGSGTVLWARQATGNYDHSGIDVTTDANGNTFVCGGFYSEISFGSGFGFNLWAGGNYLVKYDAAGNVQWAVMPDTSVGNATEVEADAVGNVYLAGAKKLVKYDSSSNVLWTKSLGDARATNIYTRPSGNTYLTGYFTTPTLVMGNNTLVNSGGGALFAAECDASGNMIWTRGGGAISSGTGICVDQNATVYVSGAFSNPGLVMGPDTLRSYLGVNMFVGSLGNPLGIKNELINNATVAVYPNPFSQYTILNFGRAFRNSTLNLTNSKGQKIREMKGLSGQSITLNRGDLPAGLYFFNVVEGGVNIGSGKLIVID